MKVEIEICDVNRYEEFLRVLNTAFGYDGEDWFSENIAHVCPYPCEACADDIAKHLIAVVDGRIVGGLGVYPVEWVVTGPGGKAGVKAAGIGQVCCLPEYRNNGIMSLLLEKSISFMEQNSVLISWLGGDKFRYGHFGWVTAGREISFRIRSKRLMERIKGYDEEYSVYEAGNEHIPLLNELYNELPSYVARGVKQWERHISRKNICFLICESSGRTGYIGYNLSNPGTVLELGGDTGCIARATLWLLEKSDKRDATVLYPLANTPISRYLYEAANHYDIHPEFLARVIDGDELAKALAPYGGEDCINAMLDDGLRGYLGGKAALCGKAEPMCLWIPHVDDV